MMSSHLDSPTDIRPPMAVCVLDTPEGEVSRRVRVLGVDGDTAYGVRYDSGERVRLENLDALIANGRLRPGDFCATG